LKSNRRRTGWRIGLIGAASIAAVPGAALATQAHGDPEGLYGHQLSHLFLAFSMGLLIFWLRRRNLARTDGWRFIQYSAALFILWTLDAFTVHLMDEQYPIIRVTRLEHWTIRIDAFPDAAWIKILYYVVKLDHLLCVPALFMLYSGLKRLLTKPAADGDAAGP